MLFVAFFGGCCSNIYKYAANAEEQKTYTLTEVKTVVVNILNVGNFLTNEVEKTKEYQKKSWEEMKTQTIQNWSQLKSLFGVKN